MTTPITILIAALGGEGGGVLAEWLVDLATRAGHPAQATSIPGVAQRTGATTYYIEIHPQPWSALGGRAPVMSLAPVPGCLDLMVASELLEAVRAIQNGFVSKERTRLVTSSHRTLTTFEKMAMGDGRFDGERLLDVARLNSAQLTAFDMDAATRAAGTVPSAVMFGAIAGSGLLPFPRSAFEDVIRQGGKGVEASLRGFAAGFERTAATTAVPPAPTFPNPDLVLHGLARVVEFQDAAYGALFMQRVERLRKTEQRHGGDGSLVREGGRFLALWMAFDDIVRVADFKSRASRFARVRSEVAAKPDDLLRIVDIFKPGATEFAGLLPVGLAKRLLAWDARRRAAGQGPLAFPLKLRTDSVFGLLALRVLASLKGWRRRGARFAEEQTLIERWLTAVEAAPDGDTAFELALCARLVKGYGATNERAKENLRHILDHVATKGAAAIRQACEAALKDEGGEALDQALVRIGAPARPVKAVPVQWFPRKVKA